MCSWHYVTCDLILFPLGCEYPWNPLGCGQCAQARRASFGEKGETAGHKPTRLNHKGVAWWLQEEVDTYLQWHSPNGHAWKMDVAPPVRSAPDALCHHQMWPD